MKTNIIYNENCLETMKCFEDGAIDCVITSPPYNMNLRIRNGKYCSRQIVKELSTKYDNFDDNLPIEEFYNLHHSILSEIVRVSKIAFYNIQIVTGSKRAFFKLIGDFSEHMKDVIIWDKTHAEPAIQSGVMNSQFELLLILGDNPISRRFSKSNFDRVTLSNIWQIKKGRSPSKKHRAVFPETLVNEILNNFTKEGDIVYDPFLGTGTTAVCCNKLNRKYIGSELIEESFEFAKKRLDNE